MNRIVFFALATSMLMSTAMAQVPQKFAYQASVRGENGNILINQSLDVKVQLRKTAAEGLVVYSEEHQTTTNAAGIVSLTVGNGTSSVGNFSETPWEEQIFLQIDIKLSGQTAFTTMGVSQILSVPYAMKSGDAIQGESVDGNTVTFSGSTWLGTNQVNLSTDRVEVKALEGRDVNEPIFVVRNLAGDVVFAVYESGVRINIDDSDSRAEKGGFAVGGLSTGKTGKEVTYFSLEPDSVRFNILESPDPTKAEKGGFAVGGLSTGKEITHDYFSLSVDSVRFTILEYDTTETKASKGGFAVGGLSNSSRETTTYFTTHKDSTVIYTDLTTTGNVNVSGNIYTGGDTNSPPIYDFEGNEYQTVKIGNQTWMKENLRTVYDNMGELLGYEDVFCYNSDCDTHAQTYGLLYSWPVVSSASPLCPEGWHIPGDGDWQTLFSFVGGQNWESNPLAAARVMEASGLWTSPEITPTNQTKFSARPGGKGDFTGNSWVYSDMGQTGYFWTMFWWLGGVGALKINGTSGVSFDNNYNEEMPNVAFSVRCVKSDWK
jgi:uncharacterized protein (TIGR02145 family)